MFTVFGVCGAAVLALFGNVMRARNDKGEINKRNMNVVCMKLLHVVKL